MEVEEILKTAIKIEEEGIGFYTKSARLVDDETGKQTLLFLAEEEMRHKAFFEGVLDSRGDPNKAIGKLQAPRIFPKPRSYEPGTTRSTDQGILEHALENEKKSIEFYSKALGEASDKDLCSGLEIIIKEEQQHAEWITYLIGTIGSHGYWTGLEDHFSLDGG